MEKLNIQFTKFMGNWIVVILGFGQKKRRARA
jgi:hypothetical protein